MDGIEIVRIFVSPGHNFYGHDKDGPPSEHAAEEVESVECVAGRGLIGDRFFDYQPDYKGQVTFFAAEVFEALCEKFGVEGASPGVLRRNVITRGVDLNEWIGMKFEVQGVGFEGTEEARPCLWMNGAFAPGAREAMRGRGGVRARVLTDGELRVGTF
ncbi:MAG: MOSC domain-containing protein [Chthoniobacterales bacterium]